MRSTQLEESDARKGLLRGITHADPSQPLLSWYEINKNDNSDFVEGPSLVRHEEEINCNGEWCLHIRNCIFTRGKSLVTMSRGFFVSLL